MQKASLKRAKSWLVAVPVVLAATILSIGFATQPQVYAEDTPVAYELSFGQEPVVIDAAKGPEAMVTMSPELIAHKVGELHDVVFSMKLPEDVALAGDVQVESNGPKGRTLDEEAIVNGEVRVTFDSINCEGIDAKGEDSSPDLRVSVPVQFGTDRTEDISVPVTVSAKEVEEPLEATQVITFAKKAEVAPTLAKTALVGFGASKVAENDSSQVPAVIAERTGTASNEIIEISNTATVAVTQESDTASWTIKVTNKSDDEIENLPMKDVISAHATVKTMIFGPEFGPDVDEAHRAQMVQTMSGQGSASASWSIKVPPQSSASLTLECPVSSDYADDDAASVIENTASATVKGQKELSVQANKTVQLVRPQLTAKKRLLTAGPKAGGDAQIEITVSNTVKASHADELSLTEVLPEGVTFKSLDKSDGLKLADTPSAAAAGGENTVTFVAEDAVTVGNKQAISEALGGGVLTDGNGKELTPKDSLSATFTVHIDENASGTLTTETRANAKVLRAPMNEDEWKLDIALDGPSLQLEKAVTPVKAQPGQEVQFSFVIRNVGSAVASDATLEDLLPDGLEWIPQENVTVEDNKLVQDLGEIESGEKVEISNVRAKVVASQQSTITNTATVSANGVAPVPASAELSIVKPFLRVEKTADRDFAAPGDIVNYEVTVINPEGAPDVKNIVISDEMPQGLTLRPDVITSDDFANAEVDGNKLTVTLEELAAGKQLKIAYSANVGNDVSSDFTNTVNVRAEAMDDESAKKPVTGLKPGLNISQEIESLKVQSGVEIPVKVSLANGSEGTTLRGAKVEIQLPEGVQFTRMIDNSQVKNYTATKEGLITVSFNDIKSGDEPAFTYGLKVVDAEPKTYDISAKGSADGVESVGAAAMLEVVAPSLEITKTVDNDKVNAGETVNYVVTVKNTGDVDATNVQLTDVLPSGLKLTAAPKTGASSAGSEDSPSAPSDSVDSESSEQKGEEGASPAAAAAEASSFNVSETNNGWQATAETFGAGESVSFSYAAVAEGASAKPLVNTATVKATNVEPETATASVAVTGLQLKMQLNSSVKYVTKGANAQLTLSLENPSPATVNGITLNCALPSGIALVNEPSVNPNNLGFTTQKSTNGWTLTNGSLPSLQTATVSFAVNVEDVPSGTNTFNIPITANAQGVSLAQADITLDVNNSTTTGSALQGLSIAKTTVQKNVVAGGKIDYKITVSNSADNITVSGVTISDTLPSGETWNGPVTLTVANGQSATYNPSGSSPLSVQIDTLNPGQSATISYSVTIANNVGSNQVLRNIASIMDGSNTVLSATVDVTVVGETQAVASKLQDTGLPALGFGALGVGLASAVIWAVNKKRNG